MSNLLNATARQLAEPQDVPFQKDLYNGTFAGAHTLKLGLMLAQVAIRVNPSARAIGIQGYGDEPTLRAINVASEAGTLKISAPLPFMAEDSVSRSRSHRGSRNFQNNVFGGAFVGKTVVNGNSFFSGGDMVVGGDNVVFGSGVSIGGGISVVNGTVIYNDREVDMTRKILLVITVPSETSVKVKDTFGNIGIGGELQGDLGLNMSGEASVYASSVRSIRANNSGAVGVEVDTVEGRSKFDLSGACFVTAQMLRGEVKADLSGATKVTVTDRLSTSQFVEADVSGSSQFVHHGTVTGDVEFDVSGASYVGIAKVNGSVERSVSGASSAQVNGRHYTARRGW